MNLSHMQMLSATLNIYNCTMEMLSKWKDHLQELAITAMMIMDGWMDDDADCDDDEWMMMMMNG